MKTKEAKDFLVQEAIEQAARENIRLSDIEKKMMYFTESDASTCENPVELNDEFEAQYDTPEYEAKISRLLHRAFERLKGEGPQRVRQWNLAIRTLRRGDHYILVLWDTKPPTEHSVRETLRLLGAGMLIAAGIFMVIIFQTKYSFSFDRYRKYLPAPNPRLALVLFVGLFVLVLGGSRLFDRLLLFWAERRAKQGKNFE
ncbi:MAG TPA: hypothetical protein VLV88_03355 [Terriglobales bacterium]|nr:hypothetical protein [Terriglobales bacterium]